MSNEGLPESAVTPMPVDGDEVKKNGEAGPEEVLSPEAAQIYENLATAPEVQEALTEYIVAPDANSLQTVLEIFKEKIKDYSLSTAMVGTLLALLLAYGIFVVDILDSVPPKAPVAVWQVATAEASQPSDTPTPVAEDADASRIREMSRFPREVQTNLMEESLVEDLSGSMREEFSNIEAFMNTPLKDHYTPISFTQEFPFYGKLGNFDLPDHVFSNLRIKVTITKIPPWTTEDQTFYTIHFQLTGLLHEGGGRTILGSGSNFGKEPTPYSGSDFSKGVNDELVRFFSQITESDDLLPSGSFELPTPFSKEVNYRVDDPALLDKVFDTLWPTMGSSTEYYQGKPLISVSMKDQQITKVEFLSQTINGDKSIGSYEQNSQGAWHTAYSAQLYALNSGLGDAFFTAITDLSTEVLAKQ